MMLALLVVVLLAADFGDLAFMRGYWRGEADGAVIEEVWLPPEGGAMHSVFRMAKGGRTVFTEYQSVEQRDGELMLHLRHFQAGLLALEEKDAPLRWTIVRTAPNRAVFRQQGTETELEYAREGDGLTVALVKQGKRQEFRFKLRKEL